VQGNESSSWSQFCVLRIAIPACLSTSSPAAANPTQLQVNSDCAVSPPCRYEFIPQVIFLNALFGYLCFLIILKWVTGSTADLYHIMIYMFLNPMDIDCGGKCTVNLMFWGQSFIQARACHVCCVHAPQTPSCSSRLHCNNVIGLTASVNIPQTSISAACDLCVWTLPACGPPCFGWLYIPSRPT